MLMVLALSNQRFSRNPLVLLNIIGKAWFHMIIKIDDLHFSFNTYNG